MELPPTPDDQEIANAYTQGEPAVKALFRRTVAGLLAQIQALETQASAASLAQQAAPARRAIRQGEVYWLAIAPQGIEPGPAHPCVVVQDDAINHSRVNSVVVCALTTNRKKASLPGNLLLEAGEANLPKASVVEVSKLSAVDRAQFGERLGSLSEARIQQILAGMKFLQTSASGTDELAGSERQH